MCVDYTDLNKHCPKDPFGLPRNDQVVDSTASVLLCFLDCYTYTTMPFQLENAGATYQRAIQLCFKNQLHRNVEAYVDDLVIETRNPDDFISDLEETFDSLRRFWWKLKPTKFVFSVPLGKLNYSVLSSVTKESKPTQRRLPPSPT